jgi:hypothetical protein
VARVGVSHCKWLKFNSQCASAYLRLTLLMPSPFALMPSTLTHLAVSTTTPCPVLHENHMTSTPDACHVVFKHMPSLSCTRRCRLPLLAHSPPHQRPMPPKAREPLNEHLGYLLSGSRAHAVAVSHAPASPASTRAAQCFHRRPVPPNARHPQNEHRGCSFCESHACAIAVSRSPPSPASTCHCHCFLQRPVPQKCTRLIE